MDEEPVLIARRKVSLLKLLKPLSLTFVVVAEDVVDDAVEPDRCNNKRESFLDGRMLLLDDDLPLLMLLLSTLT